MTNAISYAFGDSSLGSFVAAATDRGLIFVSFDADLSDLEMRYPEATLIEDPAALSETIASLVALIDRPENDAAFTLELQGSEFECRVWKVLREIPVGSTASYGEIAARLGVPRQAREVGEACAANRLAVVVPCHRVVKKDGGISGYRWGVWRKRALLEREHRATLLQPMPADPHEETAI